MIILTKKVTMGVENLNTLTITYKEWLNLDNLSKLAEEIIDFEKKKHMADNDIAFGSQLSVEQVHNIKSMTTTPTDEEVRALRRFMKNS